MFARKQEKETTKEQPSKVTKKGLTRLGKQLVVALLVIILIWPLTLLLLWGGNRLYSMVDQTRFPDLSPSIRQMLDTVSPEAAPEAKSRVLGKAMLDRLQQELDSPFGWTVNDLFFMPTSWMDNRDHRQRGVIFATRMLVNFYATVFAKYGSAGTENNHLKEAREKYFAFTADSWWLPSSEKQYDKGIKALEAYFQELEQGEAVFNIRSDDLYSLFAFIVGREFLDQPLGMLVEENEQLKFSKLDDYCYYTQGVVLVLRDFLRTLVHLYPEIVERGGQENIELAFRSMDKICTFDPLVVLRGSHDSLFADHRGKMARYLITVRERLNDVGQSLRR
ncbi:MAG: DUF2333 family protein [Desulfohalobiaceae bacterium]|nr:DUF2333 family protein [Desulfohalobiaceae bacterium]